LRATSSVSKGCKQRAIRKSLKIGGHPPRASVGFALLLERITSGELRNGSAMKPVEKGKAVTNYDLTQQL
jgi:hypothetical protein